jgi:hypothetical protein
MLLLMETRPPKGKAWLIEYANSLGILVAWKETRTERIVSTCSIPKRLSGIIVHIGD